MNVPCETSCNHLWPFLVAIFFIIFLTFACLMPAMSATLRIVKDEERSFALGIQWFKTRILGTIPAPIIFGIIIEETCIQWHDT